MAHLAHAKESFWEQAERKTELVTKPLQNKSKRTETKKKCNEEHRHLKGSWEAVLGFDIVVRHYYHWFHSTSLGTNKQSNDERTNQRRNGASEISMRGLKYRLERIEATKIKKNLQTTEISRGYLEIRQFLDQTNCLGATYFQKNYRKNKTNEKVFKKFEKFSKKKIEKVFRMIFGSLYYRPCFTSSGKKS